jgi:glycosyltransferase involved in cell wall biosynthesis
VQRLAHERMASASLKISVVVPSYNQGKFLEQTLSSVLRQPGCDPEILLMDAGSGDETIDVIRRFEPNLAFWRSHADAGQAAAINEGFVRATGDVLCWLNSDDLHLPHTLQTVLRSFRGRSG